MSRKKKNKKRRLSSGNNRARRKNSAGRGFFDIDRGLGQAVRYHQAGELQKAREIYSRIIEIDPKNADSLHLLGVIAHQSGKSGEAVDLIQQAIRYNPENQIYHNNLGAALRDQGKPREAIFSFQRALNIKPDYAEAHYNLGNAYRSQGRLDEVIGCYRSALRFKPNYTEAYYNLGTALFHQGSLDEAVLCFEKALRLQPNLAGAYNNMGNALKAQGRLNEAIDCYRRTLELNPELAAAHYNMGSAHQDAGRQKDAIACFERAIELSPEYAEAFYSMGNAYRDLGDLDRAMDCYLRAIGCKPDYPEAHNNLGNAYKNKGRLKEAIASFERALEYNPRLGAALNNMGNAYIDLGDLDGAIDCYRKALDASPHLAEPYYNLGQALMKRGDSAQEAIDSYRRAVKMAPGDRSYMQGFSRSLRMTPTYRADESFKHDLIHCLAARDIDKQGLVKAAAGILGRVDEIGQMIAWAGEERLDELSRSIREGRLFDARCLDLLLVLMESSLIADPGMERLLTRVRRVLTGLASEGLDHSFDTGARFRFLCALAEQCFINEYVFFETHGETALVEELRAEVEESLAGTGPVRRSLVALLAAYVPLYRLGSAHKIMEMGEDDAEGHFGRLVLRQIAEPAREMELQREISALTRICDEVSKAVRHQYEQNPYPRWLDVSHVRPASIGAKLRQLSPTLAAKEIETPESPEVLVAGCGTGRQAIQCARFYPGGRVLALDLSLTSLAYGLRKARELGVDNIEFVQADIMELGALKRRFDVIECAGVLHHLGDPVEGWRILTDLLRAGGYMKIGLYSEIARRPIIEARDFIAQRGFEATVKDIRRCRQEMFALDPGTPMKRIVFAEDFYSTSTCRDLIFHVQEHRFTLPRIAGILKSLGLEFLTFESKDLSLINKYMARFPEDPGAASLELWHTFEEENPDTFAGMYQFWARKP